MIDYTKETTLDVKKILSEKLNIEYNDYIILDVCKIIVYSDKGKTNISLYKPSVALSTASSFSGFDKLSKLAIEAEEGLKKVIDPNR